MYVLVADDSRVMRQIVIRTLRQAGYDWKIIEAADGQEVYDLALAEQPDLILSDWNMPNATGIEALTALRQAGCDIPFGFVTSEGSQEMRDQAEAAGALFLVAKPFTAESFREVLEPVLA
ncbi:response regulator [Sanguibacter suarezii]|uniref:response regulator n=1 Tax=Sanguibacter suarezii TaxID=60921 RepID=UPI0008300408|nr:response regulator [Sanguibacter suarezii]